MCTMTPQQRRSRFQVNFDQHVDIDVIASKDSTAAFGDMPEFTRVSKDSWHSKFCETKVNVELHKPPPPRIIWVNGLPWFIVYKAFYVLCGSWNTFVGGGRSYSENSQLWPKSLSPCGTDGSLCPGSRRLFLSSTRETYVACETTILHEFEKKASRIRKTGNG